VLELLPDPRMISVNRCRSTSEIVLSAASRAVVWLVSTTVVSCKCSMRASVNASPICAGVQLRAASRARRVSSVQSRRHQLIAPMPGSGKSGWTSSGVVGAKSSYQQLTHASARPVMLAIRQR